MAATLYPTAKQHFMLGEIDLEDDTIKAVIVSTSYSYSAAHDAYDDVSAQAICTPVTLGTKSVTVVGTAAVFDAADVTPTDVDGAIGAIIIYKDTGTPSTSWLIAHLDNMAELPASISGGSCPITWDSGANKIFALTDA